MFDPSSTVVWLSYADRSYAATRLLWFTGLWMEAPVSAHRTIELYLKAFLVSHGEQIHPRSPNWGHALGDLGAACSQFESGFADQAVVRRLAFFQRYFDFVRYPNERGSPDDGSLVWFSFDSNIQPLDELVAFIRPRIQLDDTDWATSEIHEIVTSESPNTVYQRRALTDSNLSLATIDCSKTRVSDRPVQRGLQLRRLRMLIWAPAGIRTACQRNWGETRPDR